MNEPTEEQIRKSWKWCGFYEEDGMGVTDADSNIYYRYIYTPTGELIERYPPIDLNNLFKWAGLKLDHIQLHWDRRAGKSGCHISYNARSYYSYGGGQYDNPALVLFWAIWEVIG